MTLKNNNLHHKGWKPVHVDKYETFIFNGLVLVKLSVADFYNAIRLFQTMQYVYLSLFLKVGTHALVRLHFV